MARRDATGQIVERTTAKGTVYGLRFRATDGTRTYETLGRGQDGVTRREAEIRAEQVLARVRLGQHVTRAEKAREAAERAAQQDAIPLFGPFAEAWLERRRLLGGRGEGLTERGTADLRWRLDHLIPWFGGMLLPDITEEEVERYVLAKRTAPIGEGGLGARSLNMTLAALTSICKDAVRYRHIDRNPAADYRLPMPRPSRTHLSTAARITALLEAAGSLDAAGRTRRGHARPLLATLTFAGLRIGELLALRWSDVNLADGVLHVRDAKTDAGVRAVYLLAPLRDELAALKALRRPERDAFVFGTATGRRDAASNVRRRLLAPAVELANERLREAGDDPIPDGITPHALRRTFASILVACGEDPRYAMGQLGHADAGFTLRTYAQQMDRRDGERERLAALVRGGEPMPDAEQPVRLRAVR